MAINLRFTKENMPTAAGFVRDAFLADQAAFGAVAPADFDQAFVAELEARLAVVAKATGAALRTSGGTLVTARLYGNLEALKPLLDRLDIRLGLLGAKQLSVPAKGFGLAALRGRIGARDAEAVSKGLTVLRQAIADNLPALQTKGYQPAELTQLTDLHTAIDADNALQNQGLNAGTAATEAEAADYLALDKLLGKVLRTGRLLYRADKAKRRQYEVRAITQRVAAANQGGDKGAGPAAGGSAKN